MSKSDPDSAIFMEDTRADIARKLSQAYCPTQSKATSASQAAAGKQAAEVAAEDLRLVVT